jgi:hypothetical protein
LIIENLLEESQAIDLKDQNGMPLTFAPDYALDDPRHTINIDKLNALGWKEETSREEGFSRPLLIGTGSIPAGTDVTHPRQGLKIS